MNSSGVDAALEYLQKKEIIDFQEDELSRRAQSDAGVRHTPGPVQSTREHERRITPERSTFNPPSVVSPQKQNIGEGGIATAFDPASRISPIQLPGFKTPISFADLPPPLEDHQLLQQMSRVQIRDPRYGHMEKTRVGGGAEMTQWQMDEREGHSDSSPTRTSPPYTRSSPPYFSQPGVANLEDKTHIHISPPPEVRPHSYSPFSTSAVGQRESIAVNERSMYPKSYYSRGGVIGNGPTRVTPSNDLSDSGIEEEITPRRTPVPAEAFKFFMEQHVENIYKAYHQRMQRRLKLEQEMGKRGLDDPTSVQMRKILFQKESNFLRIKRAKMHKDLFKTVKPLGIGAFGVVSLVRKIDSNRLYAMKTLRKADVLRRNQVAHVKAERDILAEADNEWVVKLFFSFQDSENLYFVMEYIPGGDMMSLLIKLGTFPEHLALFYIAELVCAIESVHKMGFIHRDIKPDNILIGNDGHIKLTDFGLCTGFRWTHDSKRYLPKGQHQRYHSMEPGQWEDEEPLKPLEMRRLRETDRSIAHSLVGTPNYIAPEILQRIGYKQLCDWWSVGVIMYEMLVGQPPFMAPTPSETQHKIMNWSHYLHIPRHTAMSDAAANLILRFCSDPMERIGKHGPEEIKRHSFFSAVDWSVGIRNYEPPYIPKIMFDADTSNFDPIPQSQLQKLQSKKLPEVSSLPKGQPEHAFYEWTFIRFYPERGVGGHKKPGLTPASVQQRSNPPDQHYSANSSQPPPPPPPSSSRTSSIEGRHERERKPTTPPSTATSSSTSSSMSARDHQRTTPLPVYV